MDAPQIDAEEQELRDLGRQQDLAEGRPVSTEGTTAPEKTVPPAEAPEPPQQRPEQTPPDSEPEPEPPPQPRQQPEARERDERGRFKQQNGQQEEPPPPSEPPRSPYQQAREREGREQERRDRSWRALQADKDAFRDEQAQWQEQRRMEQLQAQAQVPVLQKDGIDLRGYHAAYLDFRNRGDWENATKSLETVLELEQAGQQEIANRQEASYELAWRNDMEATIQSLPDLMNPENLLTQETDRIINEHPYLFYIPQGFQKAVEIATLLLASGSDSELREENERLRAQIEEYQASSQPAQGGLARPPRGAPTRQEDMTPEEEERYLRELTRHEDALMGR